MTLGTRAVALMIRPMQDAICYGCEKEIRYSARDKAKEVVALRSEQFRQGVQVEVQKLRREMTFLDTHRDAAAERPATGLVAFLSFLTGHRMLEDLSREGGSTPTLTLDG